MAVSSNTALLNRSESRIRVMGFGWAIVSIPEDLGAIELKAPSIKANIMGWRDDMEPWGESHDDGTDQQRSAPS